MSPKPNLEAELELAQAGERKLLVADALRRAGANEEGVDLLTPRLGKCVLLASKEGARAIEVLAPDGAVSSSSLDDLVNEAKRKFGSLFQPRSAAPAVVQAKSEFRTERERSEFVKLHGLSAYEALPQKAPVRSVQRKSEFVSEAHRAQWVSEHGLTAYNKLPA